MIKIYGIKNCDTVQKAIKWLNVRNTGFLFHDYKDSGIDRETIEGWLKHFPVDKLINMRSTTFRELTESERAGIVSKSKAIALMIKYNSIIKRPVWDIGNGVFFLGWDEQALNKLIK